MSIHLQSSKKRFMERKGNQKNGEGISDSGCTLHVCTKNLSCIWYATYISIKLFGYGFFFVICLFFETGSHYVTQAGLKLNNSPVLGFQMLGLQACATTPSVFALLREGIIN
jgi:hypothetical protein